MSEVVTLKVQRSAKRTRPLVLARNSTPCDHRHTQIDPELAQLTCLDCRERLDPMAFIERIGRQFDFWEYERAAIERARAELEARRRCRCTHCGKSTEIRRVSDREFAQLRARGKESP